MTDFFTTAVSAVLSAVLALPWAAAFLLHGLGVPGLLPDDFPRFWS